MEASGAAVNLKNGFSTSKQVPTMCKLDQSLSAASSLYRFESLKYVSLAFLTTVKRAWRLRNLSGEDQLAPITVRPELAATEFIANCCCCFRFFLFIFFFLFRSDTFDGAWTGGERDLERELERVLERDLTRDLLRDLDLERDLEEEEEGDDFFRKAVEPNGFVCPLSLKEIWGLEVAIACGFNAVIPPNPVPILNGEFPAGELLLNGVVGKPAPPVLKPPTPLFNAFVGVESTCITSIKV